MDIKNTISPTPEPDAIDYSFLIEKAVEKATAYADKTIAILEKQVADKDSQIDDLRQQVADLRQQVALMTKKEHLELPVESSIKM